MNIATIPYGESNADFEEVLDFLQYFGHCIHKVILWNDFMDKQLGETLHKQISKYVAKSVNAIEYQMRDALNSMRDLMVPYPNVESAKLYGGDFDVEIDDETLHQMFPAVRTLDLNSMEMHESLSYFPTLERLTIPQNLATNQSDLPLLERTLELNPSFKHLIIRNCSHWNVLQAVNRIRPDLESLEFAYQNIVGHNARAEPMYFPNMKFFKCVMWPGFRSEGSVRIPPLKFGNLEEIEFEHKHLVDYWLDILMQNKNLRKLSASFELEHEHLKQIANGLPNLEEFKMLCSFAGPKPLRTIVDFLRSANQLKKAAFGELREKDCAKAAEQLKGNWEKVKAIRKSTCLLVRKTLWNVFFLVWN